MTRALSNINTAARELEQLKTINKIRSMIVLNNERKLCYLSVSFPLTFQ